MPCQRFAATVVSGDSPGGWPGPPPTYLQLPHAGGPQPSGIANRRERLRDSDAVPCGRPVPRLLLSLTYLSLQRMLSLAVSAALLPSSAEPAAPAVPPSPAARLPPLARADWHALPTTPDGDPGDPTALPLAPSLSDSTAAFAPGSSASASRSAGGGLVRPRLSLRLGSRSACLLEATPNVTGK